MSELVDLLTGDAGDLEENTDGLPEYKNRAIGLVTSYQKPSKNFDIYALDALSSANSVKTSIVTIGGNVGLNTLCYSDDLSYITSTYGSIVISTGQTYGEELGIVGIGESIVAYGVIKADKLEAYRYPKIENIDVNDDDPFDGEGYVTVNSGNAGIGKDTVYREDEGSEIGKVFSILTTGGCTGTEIANNVSSLIPQYDNHATNIDSYADLATSVKKYKTEYQFHVWSYSRSIKENDDDSADMKQVAGILSQTSYGGPY